MGPHTWHDWVAEMHKLLRSHPSLTWTPGLDVHTATWEDEHGRHRVERAHLGDLVLLLETKLRKP